jgi:hypothetical protein
LPYHLHIFFSFDDSISLKISDFKSPFLKDDCSHSNWFADRFCSARHFISFLKIPLYTDLAAGARPIVSQTYWTGNDFVFEVRADRSMLVNLGGVLGVGDAAPLVVGLITGAGIGAGAAQNSGQFMQDFDSTDIEEPADDSDTAEEPAPARKAPY